MSAQIHKLRHLPLGMRTRTQVLLCLGFILLLSQAAAAQSNNIYELRGTADFGIYHINAATGTVTTLFTGYPGGSSATIAQRPTDGMLFYAINATNGQVYRYNPATPGVAPVALTSTLGSSVPASFRMAFSPSGTLYYMPDTGVLYTINQVTGVATAGPTVTGIGSGGDMGFSSGGVLYVINSSRQLYTAPLGGGAATSLGTVTFPSGTPATLGLAFDASGVMRVQTQNPSTMYDVVGLTASNPIAIGGGTTSTGDLASSAAPNPDLSITKTNGVSSVYQGGPVTYTIVVTNRSAYAVTGTVNDTVPASVTGVTWNCVASAGSSCALASGSGNTINTGATLLPNGTATYTVSGTVAAGATGTLTNTATVAPPAFLPDTNAADNTATDSDPINVRADLSITKTDGLASINSGSPVTYTIVVQNSATSSGASNGSIITDTVPATITGVNWTCGSATLGATCGAASGSGNVINTTANLPVGSSLTYTVTGTLSPSATGTLSNTATIITPASGVSDPTDLARTGAGNNSATDTTTINAVPDLTIAKTHSGNFTVGVNGSYTLTARNQGSANTSGTITVIDNLPAGLTIAAALPAGTGWNCSSTVVGSSTATCTSSTVINAGTTSPNPIMVTVVVGAAAFPSVTNTAAISGGGEPASNNGNNSASDPTTVNAAPPPIVNLLKSVSPGGTQVPGTDLIYTIVYTNSGGQPANNLIIVDPNPANAVPAERVFRNVDFKVGSLTSSPGSTGLAVTFAYSNDGGATWTYTPVSGAGGAAAGYDRVVTNVRWVFSGALSQTSPNNTGSVSFTAKIR